MATLPPRNGNPAELTTVIPPFTVTPEQGLRNTLAEIGSAATVTYNNGSNIASAVALARQSEVVIVMVGTTPRETRDLPNSLFPSFRPWTPPRRQTRATLRRTMRGSPAPKRPPL